MKICVVLIFGVLLLWLGCRFLADELANRAGKSFALQMVAGLPSSTQTFVMKSESTQALVSSIVFIVVGSINIVGMLLFALFGKKLLLKAAAYVDLAFLPIGTLVGIVILRGYIHKQQEASESGVP